MLILFRIWSFSWMKRKGEAKYFAPWMFYNVFIFHNGPILHLVSPKILLREIRIVPYEYRYLDIFFGKNNAKTLFLYEYLVSKISSIRIIPRYSVFSLTIKSHFPLVWLCQSISGCCLVGKKPFKRLGWPLIKFY